MALALGLWGQTAMATEEPAYEKLSTHGHIELRRYAPFIVAETTVAGDMDAASNKGFRAIADYIAGMTDRYAMREHRRLFAVGEI